MTKRRNGPLGWGAVFVVFVMVLGCEPPSTNPERDPQAVNAVAVAEAFLHALSRADTAALRLHSVPSTRLVALTEDEQVEPRVTPLDSFLVAVQADSGRYLERMWAPQAHIEGRLATVWTHYDFYRDLKFSHCGVDSFDLVRMGHTWKVLSIVYTIQPNNCELSPLGEPFPGAPTA